MNFTPRQLLRRLHSDRAFVETARIIGYQGVEMAAFWAAAKSLGVSQARLLDAVYELTRPDKREATPPRYELRDDVRNLCWQLLGPALDQVDAFWRHPDSTPMERPIRGTDRAGQPLAEPGKNARRPRSR